MYHQLAENNLDVLSYFFLVVSFLGGFAVSAAFFGL